MITSLDTGESEPNCSLRLHLVQASTAGQGANCTAPALLPALGWRWSLGPQHALAANLGLGRGVELGEGFVHEVALLWINRDAGLDVGFHQLMHARDERHLVL